MKFLKVLILAFGFIFSASVFAGPVDVNIADAATLAANIKGVGLKKAAAIVAYREANGPFKKIEDLVKVKGIGVKLLEKNRVNIQIAKASMNQ